MSTIVIRVNGVDVTADVVIAGARFVSVADGNAGTAEFTIDDQAQQYTTADFRAGMTLELLIDGKREWDGWVFKVGRAWPFDADDTSTPSDVPRYWKIFGHDRNVLWQKRVLYNQADPSDDSGLPIWPEDTADRTALFQILNEFVDLSGDGLTFDIQQISSPGPFEEFTLGFVSGPLGVAFEDASKMTGGVFWISPDRVLTYKDDLTITAPWNLSDRPTGTERGYREFEAALDYAHAANEALVWGAGKGSSDPVFAKYTDAASVATHGLWQWGDIFVGAWKQTTVNRRARTYVEGSPNHRRGHDDPVPVVRFSLFEPGLQVGMVARFESEVFGYSEPLPVRQVAITFPTEDSAKFDYEMTLRVDTPFGIPDPWLPAPWDDPPPEVLPPEGPDVVDPPTPGGGNLIDHYDDNPNSQVWTHSVIDSGLKAVWDIELPVVPGGIQFDDVIMVAFTHTPQPSTSGPWGPEPDHPFDGQTFKVRKYLDASPTSFYAFLPLINTTSYPAIQYVEYLRVTGTMDFIGQTAPTIKLETESLSDTTRVAYVSIVLRGSAGPPGIIRDFVGLPTAFSDNGSSFGPNVFAQRLNDYNLQGRDDLVLFTFSAFGGIDASGNPSVVGQHYTIIPPLVGTGNPVSYFADNSYEIMELNTHTTSTHPAFILAVANPRPSGEPAGENQGPFVRFPDAGPLNNNNSTIYSSTHWGFGVKTAPYETPGPAITNAPWAGGNRYVKSYQNPNIDYDGRIEGSTIRLGIPTEGPTYWQVFDTELELTNYQGDIVGTPSGDPLYPAYPWSGFSTSYWSGGVMPNEVDLLIKWRYSGADNTRQIIAGLDTLVIPDDPGTYGENVAVCQVFFGIGSGVGVYKDDIFNFVDIVDQSEADPGAPVNFTHPSFAYDGFTEVRPAGTWYWTRIFLPAPPNPWQWGHPYTAGGSYTDINNTNLPLAKSKTWPYGTPEPTSGTSVPFLWYWVGDFASPPPGDLTGTVDEGWTVALPFAWYLNGNGQPEPSEKWTYFRYANGLRLEATGVPAGEYFEIDGVWRYSAALDQGGAGGPGTGTTVTDVPIFDNTGANTQSSSYVTRYAYAPGSLVVYYEGVRLQPGIDYVESDPNSGRFTLLGSFNISTSLIVTYTRSGTDLTSVQSGSDGTAVNSTTFTAPSASFNDSLVGATIIINGTEYTIASVTNSTTVVVSGGTISGTNLVWDITTETAFEYRPRPVLMYGWGTALDGHNAMMAASAMALDRHTAGAYTAFVGEPRSTPPNHRGFQTNQDSRTNLSDVVTAWSNGWGQTFWNPGVSDWDTFSNRISAGRGAILEGNYGAMPVEKRFSNAYTGRHAIYINERFIDGNFLGYDPLYRYPIIYTQSDLQAFAYDLAGTGLVRAGYTQVT